MFFIVTWLCVAMFTFSHKSDDVQGIIFEDIVIRISCFIFVTTSNENNSLTIRKGAMLYIAVPKYLFIIWYTRKFIY